MESQKIIITWEDQYTSEFKAFLKNKHEGAEGELVVIDSFFPIHLYNLDIEFKKLSDFQVKTAYKSHDKKALSFARKLINNNDLNFLEYKSHNLLYIVEFWLANFFGRALQFLADFEKIESYYSSATNWHIINNPVKCDNWIAKACDELPYFILKELSEKYNFDFNSTRIEVSETSSSPFDILSNPKKELKKISFVQKLYTHYKKIYHYLKYNIVYKKSDKILLMDKWKNVKEIFEDNKKFVPIRPIYNDKMSKEGKRRLKETKKYWLKNKKLIKNKLSSDAAFSGFTDAIIYMVDLFINNEVPKIIKWIDSLEAHIRSEKIKTIFLRVDSRDNYRIGAMVGKKYDIPSVVLQHGIIGHPVTGYGFSPICVDKYLVFGKYDKRILKALGENKNKIKEVGNPKLERTYYLTNNQELRKEKSSFKRFSVLFTTATVRTTIRRTFGNTHLTSEDVHDQFRMIKNALSDLKLLDSFVIKLHPGDYKSEYHISLAQRVFGEDCNIIRNGDIVQLISEADILVTVASTTALEAMACGTPVIVIGDDFKKNYYRQMIIEGIVLHARNSEELTKKITFLKDAENWEEQSQKAKKYLKINFVLDGNAIERIKNSIIDI